MDDLRERLSQAIDEAAPSQSATPGHRLKLSHLRMIVALEEHEMVSAAALATNISQPAASRMIAEMEALLNAPLCERLARGVRLTPLGQSLARHARSVLLQLAQAEREIADLRDGRAGAAALGSVSGPASTSPRRPSPSCAPFIRGSS